MLVIMLLLKWQGKDLNNQPSQGSVCSQSIAPLHCPDSLDEKNGFCEHPQLSVNIADVKMVLVLDPVGVEVFSAEIQKWTMAYLFFSCIQLVQSVSEKQSRHQDKALDE